MDAFFGTITQALANDDRVEVRGFGVFGVKKRSARVARNTQTSEKVSVPDKRFPYFRIGKDLKAPLNKPPDDPKTSDL